MTSMPREPSETAVHYSKSTALAATCQDFTEISGKDTCPQLLTSVIAQVVPFCIVDIIKDVFNQTAFMHEDNFVQPP
jgi:hypothetical protein